MLYYYFGDNPLARRRRNHSMVEWGVHAVPTLRNRVVILLSFILQLQLFSYLIYTKFTIVNMWYNFPLAAMTYFQFFKSFIANIYCLWLIERCEVGSKYSAISSSVKILLLCFFVCQSNSLRSFLVSFLFLIHNWSFF